MVQQAFLDNEEAVIKRLKTVYNKSLEDITDKAAKLQKEFEELESIYDNIEDEEEKKVLKSRMRSKVYQKQYQESLKKQVSGIIDKLHDEDYKTVSEYLEKCYDDGFIGTMYDLQGQGIPMCFPLDQESMVRAVQLDSKISEGLYNHLGENYSLLKKRITAEVSRGIASSMTYGQVAQQLAAKMTGIYKNPGGALAYSMRIARTEGHRIQCQATMVACYNAKDRGANIVKQWDATLDGRTRDSHSAVDGEWKELDEKFSNGLMFPGDPSGRAEEVIHCRCALLQKSRDSLKNGFTKMNNFTKQLETFESPEDYAEFKKAFFSKENKAYMNHVQSMEEKYGTKKFETWLGDMTDKEYDKFSVLITNNPMFNRKGLENIPKSGTIRLGVIRDAIESGKVKPIINKELQGRHLLGNKHFKLGRSYMDMSIEDTQKLLDELKGTGNPVFDRKGEWKHKERVVCSDFVGVHVDGSTGTETKTKNLTITYSKTGCHIMPRKDDE